MPMRRQYVAAVPPRLETASRHAGFEAVDRGQHDEEHERDLEERVDDHQSPEAGDEPDRQLDADGL